MAEPLVRSPRRQIRRDLVLVALALVSVGIALNDLVTPRPHARFTVLDAVDLAIVAVFIVDFVADARRSGDWRRHLRAHWWELPALIPVNAGVIHGLDGLPLLRGFQALRLLRVTRLFRLLGATARLRVSTRYVQRIAERAGLLKISVAGVVATLAGGVAFWLLEREANPPVAAFPEALWFSFNMVTNVGLITYVPVTPGGRAVTAALQLVGIGFVGILAGSLAAAILREPPPDE